MFDTITHRRSGPDGRLDGKNHQGAHSSRVLRLEPHARDRKSRHWLTAQLTRLRPKRCTREADLVIIGLYPRATVDWLLENMPKMKRAA